ncbi:DUF433 domain-containing protein [Tautonia rosea]|uniref:DUF433 domain-containing protein n=1 Tax=Tautonia rosea TaxID=2728037 RepID=UPI001473AC16|nr:DUF433 domain-containing protein [Tautonia rosea]
MPHDVTYEPIGRLIDGLGGGIETTPEICGGEPRIAGTRITVRTLEQYRRQGMTEAQLLDAYPTLRATDLVNAWAFVTAHPETIERLILDAEED